MSTNDAFPKLTAPLPDGQAMNSADSPDGGAAQVLHGALDQARSNLLRYQELFDFAPDGYLVTDPQAVIQEANHAAAELLAASKQVLVGKPLLFFVDQPNRKSFMAHLFELPSQGRAQWEMTLAPPRKGQLTAWVAATFVSADGGPAHVRWTIRDITARTQAEQALLAQTEFNERLLEEAQVVVLVLDGTDRILRANPFACALTGYYRDELVGQPLDLLLAAGGRPTQESLGRVGTVRTKDGRTRTVIWSRLTRGTEADGRVWQLVIGSDITQLRQAQEQALQAERLAAIGQVVTGLAHESRNAIQRGEACLAILRLHLESQPKCLDLLDRAQKAQEDLHRLYEDVRSYAAQLRLQPSACDMAQVWQEAWADIALQRQGRDAELCEEGRKEDRHCRADPFHMVRVFRNILENALAATKDPVRITVRYSGTTLNGRDAIRIAVHNNGPPFTAEQRERLFEPFFTTKTHGTGLGLAICRRIVDAHDGRIKAGNSTGPGAEIVIMLPREGASPTPGPDETG